MPSQFPPAQAAIVADVISGRPTDWPAPGEMHFRLVDDRLGTLDLGCDSGYVVSDYTFDFPDVRDVTYDNSLEDGQFDLTRYIGARAVKLKIVLRPTDSPAGLTDVRSEPAMRDALLKFLHPRARPTLYFSEHGDGARVRKIGLRGQDAPFTVSKPRFNELSVSWRAPRGYIYSCDTLCCYVPFAEAVQYVYALNFDNFGTAPAQWTAVLKGDIKNPRMFMLSTQEQLWLNYDTALTNRKYGGGTYGSMKYGGMPDPREAANRVVEIDSFTRSVRINGELIGHRYVNDQSTWFTIPPGPQTVLMTHTGAIRSGFPWAFWQPASSATQWGASKMRDVTTTSFPSSETVTNPNPPPDIFVNRMDRAALAADPVYGDGVFAGPAFLPGDYVTTLDGERTHYDGTAWQVGEVPWNNPPPFGRPPWAWTTRYDPATGLPTAGEIVFCCYPCYI